MNSSITSANGNVSLPASASIANADCFHGTVQRTPGQQLHDNISSREKNSHGVELHHEENLQERFLDGPK